jgi:hypothetical protein
MHDERSESIRPTSLVHIEPIRHLLLVIPTHAHLVRKRNPGGACIAPVVIVIICVDVMEEYGLDSRY